MKERSKVTAMEIHIGAMQHLRTVFDAVNPPPMGLFRSALCILLEFRWVITCTFRIHSGRLFPLRDAPLTVVASIAQCNTGDSPELEAIKAHALDEFKTRLKTFENLLDGVLHAYEAEAKRL